MIGYVMIGTNDLDQSVRFYDVLLAPLGLVQVARVETCAAYAPKAAKDASEFYVTIPLTKVLQRPGMERWLRWPLQKCKLLRSFIGWVYKTAAAMRAPLGRAKRQQHLLWLYSRF